jgi:adenylate cyclase
MMTDQATQDEASAGGQDVATRRLAAVMVADVAAYSRLMSVNELKTHHQFQGHLNELVRPLMDVHHGHLVKTTGDGFLAEFDSATSAVECAVQFQRGMLTRNSVVGRSDRLEFRIGINVGEVIFDRDDLYGDEVNIAARLEKLAKPGGIAISRAVYRSARRQPHLSFEPLGAVRVRNIPEAVSVYHVVADQPGGDALPMADDDGDSQPRESATVDRSAERPKLIVMPFSNLGGDDAQEYFCDGLTNDLTTDLSKFKNLDVVAAHTAFHFKNRPASARQISAELGIRYLLEGSLQRNGSKVRINAQLIDAQTDRHLWAERLETKFDDIFLLQDDLIQRIVVSLAISVEAAERERAMRKEPADLNAYDAFLRGYHLWTEHLGSDLTEASLAECRRWFDLARRLDPNFARPLSTLAYSYAWGWRQGWDGDDKLELAGAYARKAVSLDPYNYDTHWDLAYCLLTVGKFDRALGEYRTALELNRNDVLLIVELAEVYSNLGDHAAGLELLDEAQALNPYSSDYYFQTLAWILYFTRDYARALTALERVRQSAQTDHLLEAVLRTRLAEQHRAQKDEDQASQQAKAARRSLERFLQYRPDWAVDREMKVHTFKRPEDEGHWREGLLLAGLPGG